MDPYCLGNPRSALCVYPVPHRRGLMFRNGLLGRWELLSEGRPRRWSSSRFLPYKCASALDSVRVSWYRCNNVPCTSVGRLRDNERGVGSVPREGIGQIGRGAGTELVETQQQSSMPLSYGHLSALNTPSLLACWLARQRISGRAHTARPRLSSILTTGQPPPDSPPRRSPLWLTVLARTTVPDSAAAEVSPATTPVIFSDKTREQSSYFFWVRPRRTPREESAVIYATPRKRPRAYSCTHPRSIIVMMELPVWSVPLSVLRKLCLRYCTFMYLLVEDGPSGECLFRRFLRVGRQGVWCGGEERQNKRLLDFSEER